MVGILRLIINLPRPSQTLCLPSDVSLLILFVLLQVGHVQPVSLIPHRTHEMKTISLKPLIFGKCNRVFGYGGVFQ